MLHDPHIPDDTQTFTGFLSWRHEASTLDGAQVLFLKTAAKLTERVILDAFTTDPLDPL